MLIVRKTTVPTPKNLAIERNRLRFEIAKWIIGGTVVIIGFLLIRPREQNRLDLEATLKIRDQERLELQRRRDIFAGYVEAQDTTDLDLWQRKLDLLSAFISSDDAPLQAFLMKEKQRLAEIRSEKKKKTQAKTEAESLRLQLAMISAEKNQLEKRIEISELSDDERAKLERQIVELKQDLADVNTQLESASDRLAKAEDKLASHGLSVDDEFQATVTVEPSGKRRTIVRFESKPPGVDVVITQIMPGVDLEAPKLTIGQTPTTSTMIPPGYYIAVFSLNDRKIAEYAFQVPFPHVAEKKPDR